MSHRLTLMCDSCGTEYMMEEDIDLPPHWISVQIVVADSEGVIVHSDKEVFMHFCSQDCFVEYAKSGEMKNMIVTADKLSQEQNDSMDGEPEDAQ